MNSHVQKPLPDHRDLNRDLQLFYASAELGQGLPLWLPNGAAVRGEIERYLQECERLADYRPVLSPAIAPEELYARSGHLPYYAASMFGAVEAPSGERYRLRPMNCPHHHLAFASRPRSYRELPLRLAEFGQVFRYENSGSLLGLMRARCLCINDAHIYVARAQIAAEIASVLDLHARVLAKLGIAGLRLRLSKRGAGPKFIDCPEEWNFCEQALRDALVASGRDFYEADDEAAFYGPKIDFQAQSARGHEESLSSVQLDFAAAARFDLRFRNAANELERPYVIHRAPIGSFERILAFLLEHHAGRLPFWLAPEQIRIVLVDEAYGSSAGDLRRRLRAAGVRAEIDVAADDAVGRRLRCAAREKIPVIVFWGAREAASGVAAVRAWNRAGRAYDESSRSVDALIAAAGDAACERDDALRPG